MDFEQQYFDAKFQSIDDKFVYVKESLSDMKDHDKLQGQKLDALAECMDDHEVRITKLERPIEANDEAPNNKWRNYGIAIGAAVTTIIATLLGTGVV